MNCSECGKSLDPNARFCPECGRKVAQPAQLEFAPLATALPICKLGFASIGPGEPEDDGVRVKVVYAIRNTTPRDWQFVSVRAVVLDADGCPIEELTDYVERAVKAGSDALLAMESDALPTRRIGQDASQAQVVVTAVAGVIEERELGEHLIPTTPNQCAQVKPRAQAEEVRIHGLSLWRTLLDHDGEAQIVLQGLVQSARDLTMPRVEFLATLKDATGKELATAHASESLPAGRTALLSACSGFIAGSALSGAKASIKARVCVPTAMGFGYCHAGRRSSDGAAPSAGARGPSPPPPVPAAPRPGDPAPAHASASASPSQVPASPEKIQAAIERFLAAVKGKARSRSIFTRPEIVKYKLENALASFAPGVEASEALVLIDSTVFGSAKDGLLVTASALYAKDLGAEPRSIPIQDVKEVKFASGMLVDMLRINGFDFFNSSGVDKVMPDFAEALATFCRDINN